VGDHNHYLIDSFRFPRPLYFGCTGESVFPKTFSQTQNTPTITATNAQVAIEKTSIFIKLMFMVAS